MFTCFVVFELVRVHMVRARYRISLFSNKWLWLAVFVSLMLQLIIIYTPLHVFFRIVPLAMSDWLLIGFGIGIFLLLGHVIIKIESKLFGE